MAYTAIHNVQPQPQAAPILHPSPQLVRTVDDDRSFDAHCHCSHPYNLMADIRHRAVHQSHIAILKSLFTPIASALCLLVGQSMIRDADYCASYKLSALGGFLGGHCLLGAVIIFNILLDTRPAPGKRWHRGLTIPAVFVACMASIVAGPLGMTIINIGHRPNGEVLDVMHAGTASAVGAAIIFCVFLTVKIVLYNSDFLQNESKQ
ncbi:hypothetical protein BD779DRAFT_559536 [Infundibulicybe gibba]|nr:hypothetical protein BD779DRAFT_559536 [Infundibulicybe gibba]